MARDDHSYLQTIEETAAERNPLTKAMNDALPGLHGPVIASALAVTLISGVPAEVQAQADHSEQNRAPARKAGNGAPYVPRKGRTYQGIAKGTGTCITVTDGADNGVGTLRDAVDQANLNPGPDCIDFDMSLQGSTITLTSGALVVNDDLNVYGPGADQLTIDGNDADRVFYAEGTGGRGGGLDLSIDGLTIQNGRAPESGPGGSVSFALGGGLFVYGYLNLSDCVLTGNVAEANAYYTDSSGSSSNAFAYAFAAGGGAFATGSIDVDSCTISNNRAEANAYAYAYTYYYGIPGSPTSYADAVAGAHGGGLAAYREINVFDSTVSGNQANAYAGADARTAYYYYFYLPRANQPGGGNRGGGGAYAYASADADGGGLATDTGDVYLLNATVSGNSAYSLASAEAYSEVGFYFSQADSFASGGGIQGGGTNDLFFSTITGNSANANIDFTFGSYSAAARGGGISYRDLGYGGDRSSNRGLGGTSLLNSIVANNSIYSVFYSNSAGPDLYDYGANVSYSLIGTYGGHGVTNGGSNIVGTDPMLDVLADNGGPTLTHLPLTGSPVIDAGTRYFGPQPPYDQRGMGFDRYQGLAPDMGAVEYASGATPTLVTMDFAYGNPMISRDEGGASVIVGFNLNQHPGAGNDVTINLDITGTATNGADFSLATSTTCTAYAATYVCDGLSIVLTDDTIFEPPETVIVDIDSVTSVNGGVYEDGMQQGTLTITDNDAPPAVSLQFNRGGSIPENGGNTDITATLSNATYQQVTVNLDFPADQAVYGTDFDMANTTITIAPFAMSGSQQLDSIDDAIFEGDETFTVGIASVVNGSENGQQLVQGTIQDNEGAPPVTLSLTGSPFAEPGGIATVTATRGGATTVDCIVDLGFTGVAVNGTDYTPSATQITIPSAMMDGSITLTGIDDALGEGDEDVIVDIVNAMNCTESGTQQVTAIITDDDEFVANVSAQKTAIGMGFMPGDTLTYLITLTNAGPGMQQDNPGDEFVDILPPELLLVSASADGGTASANVGTNTVTWNGPISVGTPVNIMIDAQILLGVDGVVINQGTVNFDSDGDGANDASAPTDDPNLPGATDPTPIQVLGAPMIIPTLSSWGMALLALLLPMTAIVALRRRGWKI